MKLYQMENLMNGLTTYLTKLVEDYQGLLIMKGQ